MENVVELSSRRSLGHVSEVMSDLETQVGSVLVHSFSATLKACDETFSMRAENERVSAQQTRYFDDLHALRRCQNLANARFRNACSAMFNQLNGAYERFEAAHAGEPELRIVGDDDLEFDLALFRIAKRCDEAASRIRHQVERRFQVLLGLAEGTAAPLSGSSLARLCRVAVSVLDLPIDSRLIILKRLERDFAAITESALDAANSIMLEHGVLPNLRAMPGKTGASMSSPMHAAPSTASLAQAHPNVRSSAHAVAQAAALPAPSADIQQAIAQVSQWIAQQTASEPAPAAARPLAAVPVAPDYLAELEASRERRRVEIAERRVVEMNRARELRIAAERSADASVNLLMQQAHVPESISEALHAPMRRYLETIYSRRGDASSDWRIASKLVRDIAWSLDPETLRSEQSHWRAMVPGIVDSLRGALFSVGLDDLKVDVVVGEFRDRYETLLGEVTVANRDADPSGDTAVEIAEVAEVATTAAPTSASTDFATVDIPKAPVSDHVSGFADALNRVRQFALGQWFELVDDSAARQTAKLIWTSARTERCMFVNRQGKLVADRTHNRIAADFLSGQFRVLEAAR